MEQGWDRVKNIKMLEKNLVLRKNYDAGFGSNHLCLRM